MTGRIAEAEALLISRAGAGDANAATLLAIWYLEGRIISRDVAKSRSLFAMGAALGNEDAGGIYVAFVAAGIGASPDWPEALRLLEARAHHDQTARAQLSLIQRMDLSDDGAPAVVPQVEPLSSSPRIAKVRGLLSVDECSFLRTCAEPLFEPSVVVEPQTGRSIRNPVRTADAAAFPLALENPAVHAINRRLAAITGTSVLQGEPLQVFRYRPGQQYGFHSDAIAGLENQRSITALIWLNEDYAGGDTAFPSLGLTVKGATGDALLFSNVDEAGVPHPGSSHAGLPVLSGTKYLASRWIRKRDVRYT